VGTILETVVFFIKTYFLSQYVKNEWHTCKFKIKKYYDTFSNEMSHPSILTSL